MEGQLEKIAQDGSMLLSALIPLYSPLTTLTTYHQALHLKALPLGIPLDDALPMHHFITIMHKFPFHVFPKELVLENPINIYQLNLHPILLNLKSW